MKKSLLKGFLALLTIVSIVVPSVASPVHAAHRGAVTFEVALSGAEKADRCCGLAVLYDDAGERERIERMAAENKIRLLRFFDGAAGDPERMRFC